MSFSPTVWLIVSVAGWGLVQPTTSAPTARLGYLLKGEGNSLPAFGVKSFWLTLHFLLTGSPTYPSTLWVPAESSSARRLAPPQVLQRITVLQYCTHPTTPNVIGPMVHRPGTEPSFSFLILLKLVKKINNNKKIKKLLKPAYIPDINNTLFCRFAEDPYSISKLKDRPYTAIMAAGVTLSIRKSVYSPAKHGWISWRLQCVALQDTVTQSIWFQTIRGLGKVLKAYFFKPD